jgi:transposase
MELSEEQYRRIAHLFPKQRGNVKYDNLSVLNAIIYVAENGCKWRSLPAKCGKWHTIYTRMNRWSKAGVLERVFAYLQLEHMCRIKVEVVALDSTYIKVHPDGTGALKKTVRRPSGFPEGDEQPNFIWLPRIPSAH